MTYFTRSKALTDWKSAGVLPFAISGCEIVILLGAERTRTGPKGKVWAYMWRDFGGGREAADADSAATAAREFAEETLGLFGGTSVDEHSVHSSADSMAQRLRDPQKALRVVHQLKKGEYHMYVTQTWLMSPLMFRLATQQNEASGAVPGGEKSAFAWVPLTDLLHAVRDARRRYLVTCRASVSGGRGTPPPCGFGRRRFLLHPCFASSLRLAQAGGLMELLSHAEALPLPPAPPMPAPPLPGADGHCSSESKGPEGPTPEHMTYWLAQESVTLELRGESGAALGSGLLEGAATAEGAAAASLTAAAVAELEPAPSHGSSVSVLAMRAAASGLEAGTQEGSSAGAGRSAAWAAAAAAAAAATVAAAAAAVAATAPPPLQAAGGQAGLGGRARRHRSRKQRQLQRQRQQREQQRQQEVRQRAAEEREGEGEGRTRLSIQPGHSGQSQQQQQQQHWAHSYWADSAADGSAWAQAQSTEGRDPGGQQPVGGDACLGPPPPPPPLPPPPPALPPPAAVPPCWAVAQDRLSKLLGPHAAPRKRIKLE